MTYNGTAESLLRQVREHTDEECLALPRSKRLAAVADDDAGPTVLPVKYVVDRGGVLFSTAAGRSGAGVGQRCGARRGTSPWRDPKTPVDLVRRWRLL